MANEILHRYTGAVLYHSADATSVREAVEAAIKSGADLGGADLGGADLGGADLGAAYLRGADLGGADLRDANLGGAYLRGADLTSANLCGANLYGAYLCGADLTGASFGEVPIVEDLDRKILDAIQRPGCSLEMASWHTCETTHCMAGWAIHLAGEAGYELERRTNSATAGAAIFARSTGRVPDFYAGNDAALEALRARVEAQTEGGAA